ncbi:MAG: winged-helix domain-containing protein [Halapricum sp.]
MSRGRDDAGRFTETVTEQQILKVFDYDDDPVLTAGEVADGLRRFGTQITTEGVRHRLDQMQEKGLVGRKKLGARAVGWWAEVAPELDTDATDRIDERRDSDDWVSL